MVFLTCSVSFRSISYRYFFFRNGNHPVPSDFHGLPYPRVRGTPGFFPIKMTARDYLDTRGLLLLQFGAIAEKPLRRGLSLVKSSLSWLVQLLTCLHPNF